MVNGGDITLRSGGDRSSLKTGNRYVLVGVSSMFRAILDVVDAVADKDCPVLLEGESGTGKELIARRIHARSRRNSGPFIPVNCPATTETLFESQFYGHVKGAFTGADTNTMGVVRAAEGGTLLLDEVGELPLHLQPKLLRLLQEREITPVGASMPIPVDTRFIASTNRSLAKAVQDGLFRSDLYHRLNIVRVEIPPLRTRPEDIGPLVDHYLRHYAIEYNAPQIELASRLRNCLREHSWPGNIRELCGYIERLYATGQPATPPSAAAWQDGYISHKTAPVPPTTCTTPVPASIPTTLADAEAQAIEQALQAAGYNRTAAAKILNIHRSTLIRKLRTLGLDKKS
ncbi:MAG: sigma-54 dependent transcriptional regulator [Phycisphaerae bacterium]|jgi:transcriptional regulator with PAS, ATPase and Fis domain|nr:sigma-54 dependent transcriptional regulator [Phycisphaerae bacterium]